MNTVLIHCKPNYLNKVKELGYDYTLADEDVLTVIVPDVEYIVQDGYYQDPDEQLCEHYGIDYDEVYSMEAC